MACAWYSVGVDPDSTLIDSEGKQILGWVTKKFDGTFVSASACTTLQSSLLLFWCWLRLCAVHDCKDEPNPANVTPLGFRYLISYYWALMNIMTVDSNGAREGGWVPRTVGIPPST